MYIQLSDTRLFFDVEGAKFVADGAGVREQPTLFIIHGGPGFDHGFFGNDHAPLVDAAQIIYLDIRGNGLSEASTPDKWSLEQWTDDVAELCDVLGLEKIIFLGFSFGGFVAQLLANRYPELLSKLILVNTFAKLNPIRPLEIIERRGGPRARTAAQAFLIDKQAEAQEEYMELCVPLYWSGKPHLERFSRRIAPPELLDHLSAEIMPTMDLSAVAATIQCPTLVISGADDPITTPADMDDLAATIPQQHLQFERIEDAAHFIIDDAPDAYFSLLPVAQVSGILTAMGAALSDQKMTIPAGDFWSTKVLISVMAMGLVAVAVFVLLHLLVGSFVDDFGLTSAQASGIAGAEMVGTAC